MTGLEHTLVTTPWLMIHEPPPLQVDPHVPGGASQVALTVQEALTSLAKKIPPLNKTKVTRKIVKIFLINCILK